MLMSIFFLSPFVVPRGVLSFPTRRSSDLVGGVAERGGGVGELGVQREAGLADLAPGCAVRDLGREPVPAGGDRKSTRLNSSHLVISYAVFCLTKKKK